MMKVRYTAERKQFGYDPTIHHGTEWFGTATPIVAYVLMRQHAARFRPDPAPFIYAIEAS